MINCDSSARCEACPIERLPEARDRVIAGIIVRRIIRDVPESRKDSITLGLLRTTAGEQAAVLGADELTAPVIGAVAINLADECKVE